MSKLTQDQIEAITFENLCIAAEIASEYPRNFIRGAEDVEHDLYRLNEVACEVGDWDDWNRADLEALYNHPECGIQAQYQEIIRGLDSSGRQNFCNGTNYGSSLYNTEYDAAVAALYDWVTAMGANDVTVDDVEALELSEVVEECLGEWSIPLEWLTGFYGVKMGVTNMIREAAE